MAQCKKTNEINELLAKVKGAYEDFVIGAQIDAKRRINGIEELRKFLVENTNADTDDVIAFIEGMACKEFREH